MAKDRSEDHRAWREANKERVAEYRKQYCQDKKAEIKQRAKEYRQENIDSIKQREKEYREANKVAVAERNKKWREANRDTIIRKTRDHHHKVVRAKTQSCPEEWLKRKLTKTMRTSYSTFNPVTIEDLMVIYNKQNGKCAITNIPMTTLHGDHKSISIDRIDSNLGYEPHNVQLVCVAINLAKKHHSQESIIEFIKLIRDVEI